MQLPVIYWGVQTKQELIANERDTPNLVSRIDFHVDCFNPLERFLELT